MSFAGRSKLTNDIMEENIECESSGDAENKNEALDIYDDSDIEINNEIEQVNNVPQIDENNEQQIKDIVAEKSNHTNTATSINLLKANDNIEYLSPDWNNHEKALIIETARKATGQK